MGMQSICPWSGKDWWIDRMMEGRQKENFMLIAEGHRERSIEMDTREGVKKLSEKIRKQRVRG